MIQELRHVSVHPKLFYMIGITDDVEHCMTLHFAVEQLKKILRAQSASDVVSAEVRIPGTLE